MCVILYNTCETGHIESSILLSLSVSCLSMQGATFINEENAYERKYFTVTQI